MSEKIIHKELSYRVMRCIFDVHNPVGPGLREECYQKAMEHRLADEGIPFLAKPRTRSQLMHCGVVADVFEPDLVVADRLILELKHQPHGFVPENVSQVISYLKHWNFELGLLINFAMDGAIVERIPRQPGKVICDEDYQHIADAVTDANRAVLRFLREGLHRVLHSIGLGYPAKTYHSVMQIECQAGGLDCSFETTVAPQFRDRALPESQISPLVINKQICVQVDAISDVVPARAIRTMQTHLRLTNCNVGLVASFGKTQLAIRGVRR